jgi:two-component system NtrC family sensor kinase
VFPLAAVLVYADGVPGFARAFLAVLLVCWTIAPHLVPRRLLAHTSFEWTLYVSDTILVALSLLSAIPGEPVLPGFFFLGALIAVLVSGTAGRVPAAFTVAAMYLVMALSSGEAAIHGWSGTALRVLFLASSGLYFMSCARRIRATLSSYHRAHREREELRDLLEITDTITGTLDLKQVMSLIVQKVGESVGAESCSILLSDDRTRNCFVLASKEQPDIDRLEIDLEKYPELRKALETREPVLVGDVQNDPLVSSARNILAEKGYNSMLVLPLLFGRDVLGTLFLRASRTEPFDPREIRFCKVVAGASANALKNSLLYQEVTLEAEHHRSASEKLRRVLDCTPDMIVATDTAGRVTEFSAGAEKITGIDGRYIEGLPMGEVLGLPGIEADEAEPDRDGMLRKDVVICNHDGEDREVSLKSAPLTGADDTEVGRVWVGRDVTHVRRVERSLAQAERLSSLGEVVAGVAHELNNPLSAVLGYSELLHRNVQNEDLGRVVEAARRCKRIVMNLLSFARKHTPETKNEDLNACVRKVLELKEYQLRAAKIQPELDLDPSLPATLFDIHQIEQVVMNLVNNAEQAIRASRTGGTVCLRTYLQGDMVCLQVEDDGPGIPTELQGRIFDPFFTTKEVGEGTGLGLSVSFGIVQEHRGRLELRQRPPGEGACFILGLPLVRTRAPREERPVRRNGDRNAEALQGRNVLVAEDEPMVLDLFTRILEQDGAVVTRARDGQEAWERMAQADFDLIIADLRMPRLDGQELYERTAEERPEMLRKFVFATGDLLHPATVSFLDGLPNSIVSKPLQVETVRHVVSRAMRKLGRG